ncbi:MAG: glycosyltransferase [Spirochaetota bacterium]
MAIHAEKRIGIISCVSNYKLYEGLQKSLHTNKHIQLTPINNTTNRYSIPSAYNTALNNCDADILVFVHQDVIFPSEWLENLDNQIKEIEKFDKKWGVLGIMGRKKNGSYAGHIIDPHINYRIGRVGLLPTPVSTLDEVCLIIRRSGGLSFDNELGGYHLYGTDICLQAQKIGLKCYAIDACLTHLSAGNVDESYYTVLTKLQEKWSRQIKCPNVIHTTVGTWRLKRGITPAIIFFIYRLRRSMIRLRKKIGLS